MVQYLGLQKSQNLSLGQRKYALRLSLNRARAAEAGQPLKEGAMVSSSAARAGKENTNISLSLHGWDVNKLNVKVHPRLP
jgi:hypothetical protein